MANNKQYGFHILSEDEPAHPETAAKQATCIQHVDAKTGRARLTRPRPHSSASLATNAASSMSTPVDRRTSSAALSISLISFVFIASVFGMGSQAVFSKIFNGAAVSRIRLPHVGSQGVVGLFGA